MWVVGENYTACSQTCGTGNHWKRNCDMIDVGIRTFTLGVQTSEIYCMNIETKERVNDSQCKDFTKEDLQPRIRNCSMPECPYE